MSPNSDDESNNGGEDDDFSYGYSRDKLSSSSSVQYTTARVITKNAASLARRRRNNASSGGGADGNGDAWFARKSVGWTDDAIKRHVTGSSNKKEEGFGMVGDVIQGVDQIIGEGTATKTTSKGDVTMQRRRIGVKFAWEEEEEDEECKINDDVSTCESQRRQIMFEAPKLSDIMDEHDEIHLMAPLQVRPEFGSGNNNTNGINDSSSSSGPPSQQQQQQKQRKTNAALDELALSTGTYLEGTGQPTTVLNNESHSIGMRILKTLGYRPRLGMAFVPISQGGKRKGEREGVDTTILDEDDSIHEHAHEKKWLAKNHLRAIVLPSILSNNQSIQQPNDLKLNDIVHTTVKEDGKKTKKNAAMTTTPTLPILNIPPPKLDVHGIGYDPYRNAPEFREYNAKRLELARIRGRDLGSSNTNEEGKYKTNNLKTKKKPWEALTNDDDSDNNDDDDVAGSNGDCHSNTSQGDRRQQYQSQHYAADRDYTDFVGTKDASGFAIDDEDDAHAYDHNNDDIDNHRKGGGDYYTTEIHSPVASDDDDSNDDINDGGMLFGDRSLSFKKQSTNEQLKNDDVVSTDAWSAWGLGVEGMNNGQRDMTMDGKPLLSGFVLGRCDVFIQSKRWAGPLPPSGYVLKRHVVETNAAIRDRTTEDATNDDHGLGMYLHSRHSIAPKVLPPSTTTTGERRHTSKLSSDKLLAKDGSELNFHAVRESMKNRFVVSSAGGTIDPSSVVAPSQVVTNDDNNNKPPNRDLDAIEFVESSITSWMPTRLLCKRWGVPVVPSISGVNSSGDEPSKQAKSTEEGYFRHTVYDPAVADRKKDDHTKKTTTSTSNGAVVKLDTIGVGIDSSTVYGNVEEGLNTMDPPPTRPPADIFRSIFDTTAESDMEMSSSDDDNDDSRAIDGSLEEENFITQTKVESEKGSIIPEPNGEFVKANISHPTDTTGDGDSSSSSQSTRRKSRKSHYRDRDDRDYKKERHDRHRRRRDSTRSNDSDDVRKKTKKKKKHRV